MTCGHLLHSYPVAGGALLVITESEEECPSAATTTDRLPVKLSDDPEWPDGYGSGISLTALN